MKRLLFLLIAPLLLIPLASCGVVRAYAVKVNGIVISRSSLDAELADIAHNTTYRQIIDQQHDQQGGPGPVEGTAKGTYTQSFTSYVLTQRVEYQLVHDELVRRRHLPSPSDVDRARPTVIRRFTQSTPGDVFQAFPAAYQRTLIERQAEVTALVMTFSDADVHSYYTSHSGDFATELCVRHILITGKDAKGNIDFAASKARALQIKGQLDAGADFAALAKSVSADTQSAVNGGKLPGNAPDGCLGSQDASQLVQPFAQAIATLPVNQVSDPVQTQFGYHLIEVTDRKLSDFNSRVAQSARQSMLLTLLQQRLAGASIKVNPEFGSFDKSRAAIVPPAAPATSGSTTASTPTG
ncbi:MAG TPA: peptidylprolyl isomerase [Acidimicrobiales bacterium]